MTFWLGWAHVGSVQVDASAPAPSARRPIRADSDCSSHGRRLMLPMTCSRCQYQAGLLPFRHELRSEDVSDVSIGY